ncbi:sugar transporter STL1 [Verticillium alfalfae VaMs.102]|uniref:Sugar transporter STL1 n=1 Tax=Verticillium alfalfae (strain VaMs.102 / ATCC MYA-4576 / FGSC 10136) TaxID=526221 RepID=C9SNU8_VERA1|nr:sugar transporter STL1 [Verticillium alfalfae VaMs.102]EEY20463.1 sugar transporter STL1 [Verticillium alfalfae VaMs.102]
MSEKSDRADTINNHQGTVDSTPKSGFSRFCSKMGDLPQWKVNGKLLRGAALNWGIGVIASCGFLMFGYDQGVLSGLLTLDDFQKNQALMTPLDASNPLCWNDDGSRDERYCHGDANTQAAGVAMYQIGCFLGAVLILFYGESWGRRSSTFWGSLIMIIGGIMQAASLEYGLFVSGRVIGGRFKRLLTNRPSQKLRRTLLGIAAQFFQQICGITLITYYATFVFENSLGFGPQLSRLLAALNGTEYFLASLVALPLIERVGRRKLMLFGAFGMMGSMAILAGTTSTGTTNEDGAPQLSTAYGVTAVVFLFAFNSFFAVGWLGMTWLYPAEVTGLNIRIQANALSTCSNWISNFLIVMITPPAFANLQWKTYVMFAVFNAALIPCVYLYFPETSKRSLEEIDLYFARAWSEGVSPVKMAKTMPRYTATELDNELAKYFSAADIEQRRGSMLQSRRPSAMTQAPDEPSVNKNATQ